MSPRGTPSRFGADQAPPENLYSRIRAAVAATPAGTTPTRKRIVAALFAIPCLTAVVLLVASGVVYHRPTVRLDLSEGAPAHHLLAMLVALVALTLVATLVAVGRGRHGFGSGAVSLLMAAALVGPVYAGLTLVHPVMGPDPLALSRWGLPCLSISIAVGTTVLVSLTLALRRSVPSASGLRGAAVGAAAGAWAGLSVFLFCPAGEHRHLLVGHVLPVVAFTILGALLVPRALRP